MEDMRYKHSSVEVEKNHHLLCQLVEDWIEMDAEPLLM